MITTSGWRDQMTTVNGSGITYDGAGNPTEYHDGTEFIWDGRELTYVGKTNGNQYTYFYNADGIRDTKQVFEGSSFVTHNYRLMGDKVVEDKWGVNQRLVFMYDENGAPNTVYYYNGSTSATKYYYVLNLQGDVTEIRSTSNALVAQYNYDAFGNILSIKDANGNNITSSTHIANVNPLRYRGYFYDTETGFYYLNSRYYDPATRRFISADTIVDGRDFDGMNLYAYCWNNPVTHTDASGNIVTAWDEAHLSNYEVAMLQLYTSHYGRTNSASTKNSLHSLAVGLRTPYLSEGEFVGEEGNIYCDITSKLNYAMYHNAQEFNADKSHLDPVKKLWDFMQKSKTGAEWDFKNVYDIDRNVIYLYDEIPIRHDAIGNIHFGYVGAAAGYSLDFLQFGAGMYQIYSGTSDWSFYKSYFDDPYDSMMIELGFNRYKWGF